MRYPVKIWLRNSLSQTIPGYGVSPRENISYKATPKDQMTELIENSKSFSDSGFHGSGIFELLTQNESITPFGI